MKDGDTKNVVELGKVFPDLLLGDVRFDKFMIGVGLFGFG